MSTIPPSLVEGEVSCHALVLALVATQLRTAWHAGVVDGDSAMRCLDEAIRIILEARRPDPRPEPDAVAIRTLEDRHVTSPGGR